MNTPPPAVGIGPEGYARRLRAAAQHAADLELRVRAALITPEAALPGEAVVLLAVAPVGPTPE